MASKQYIPISNRGTEVFNVTKPSNIALFKYYGGCILSNGSMKMPSWENELPNSQLVVKLNSCSCQKQVELYMLLHASYALVNCILVTVPKDLSSDRFVLSKVGNSFLPQFHVQLSTTNSFSFICPMLVLLSPFLGRWYCNNIGEHQLSKTTRSKAMYSKFCSFISCSFFFQKQQRYIIIYY